MFDISLALNLTAHTFSFKKDSLRFPTPRRIFSVFFALPFFLVLIIINRIFMLLDWVIFPGFRKIEVKKSCFIIGVARSATTYLYNILAKDKEHFTCFKLWEILFAPSIIQKYFLSGLLKSDRFIGNPLYKLSLLLDKLFLGKIARLHEISFSNPEEDEMLLIYAFSSMYLSYFYPDVPALNQHLFFDESIPPKKRKQIMLFYKRCVQRHIYVYDRKEEKIFLSKNPAFVSKTATIAETFPEANLLYMLRSPFKTIPSTISLNANVYALFSGKKKETPLAAKTTEAIIKWYKMANDSLLKNWRHRNMVVPFKKITGQPEATIKTIYQFLKIIPGQKIGQLLKAEEENSRNYKSEHQYDNKSGLPDETILSHLDLVINGKYGNEI